MCFFFFQAEDGIRDGHVTGVQTCALPILIFLMMAAHDTSTSAITTMIYQLAAHPEWQQRCRDESARLGDGRSEERRVGKERRARWPTGHEHRKAKHKHTDEQQDTN